MFHEDSCTMTVSHRCKCCVNRTHKFMQIMLTEVTITVMYGIQTWLNKALAASMSCVIYVSSGYYYLDELVCVVILRHCVSRGKMRSALLISDSWQSKQSVFPLTFTKFRFYNPGLAKGCYITTRDRARPLGQNDIRPQISQRRASFTWGPEVHQPVRQNVRSGQVGSQPRVPTRSSSRLESTVVTM